MRVVLLTRSLEVGGAERQLTTLARGLAARGHDVAVLAMYPGGPLGEGLQDAGVKLVEMDKAGRWDMAFLLRLAWRLRRLKPRVVCSFLDTPNLIAAGLKPLLGGAKVVWQVRAAYMDLSRFGRFAAGAQRLTYPMSRLAHGVVLNSWAAKEHHLARGLKAKRLAVIPNGIDTAHFCFDAAGRQAMRARWGVGEGETLVGLAARLDPMKDHESFLRAGRIMLDARPGLRLVCIGGGPQEARLLLERRAHDLGLDRALIWAGEMADMPAALSALDLAVQSSYGESFPNAPAEAMACARPVVVTGVGDSARLVGRPPAPDMPGLVVPARDEAALAAAALKVLALSPAQRGELGAALRERIEGSFSQEAMVAATEAFFIEVTGGARP